MTLSTTTTTKLILSLSTSTYLRSLHDITLHVMLCHDNHFFWMGLDGSET